MSSLGDSETVLFVNDYEGKFFKKNIFLYKGMGANYNIYKTRFNRVYILRTTNSFKIRFSGIEDILICVGKQSDGYVFFLKQGSKGMEMLKSQYFRGSKEGSLIAL